MGQVTRYVRRVLFIIAACACLVITYSNVNDVNVSISGTFYIVGESVETYYEMLSDNVGLTTPNGISNVYVNMAADQYQVYSETVTPTYVDVTFTKKDSPTYRYYYDHQSGRITFFSSDYENSFLGLAYIIDKRD